MNLSPQNLATIRAIADDIRAQIGDDDAETLIDTLDGETPALDLIDDMLRQDAEARAFAEALKAEKAALDARKSALEYRSETIRAGLGKLLDAIGERKISRPLGTISRTKPRDRVVIDDANAIPQGYAAIVRKPDAKAIKAALDAGEAIPGAHLETGPAGVAVRR